MPEYKLSYTASEIDAKLGEIDNLAKKSEIPTKTSQLTNNSGFLTSIPSEYVTETELNTKGYLTEHQDLSNYALKEEIPEVPVLSVNGKTGNVNISAEDVGALPSTTIIPTVPTNVSAFTNDAGYLTEHQSLADYVKTSDLGALATKDELSAEDVGALPSNTVIPDSLADLTDDSTHRVVTDEEKVAWNAKSNFSGNYNDLSNKPTIPSIAGLATEDYVDNAISAIPTPDVSGQIGTHNTATDAHNDIRLLVDGLTTRLNTLADSDDTTLDQMSEVVAYIKSNKTLIEEVTSNKVSVSDIINNLTTNVSNKPLSAAQGVALKALIDAIKVPTKVSELTNDAGYLTSVPVEYITETELTAKGYLTNIPSEYVTDTELNAKGYLTEHQSLAEYVKATDLEDLAADIAIQPDWEQNDETALDYIKNRPFYSKANDVDHDSSMFTDQFAYGKNGDSFSIGTLNDANYGITYGDNAASINLLNSNGEGLIVGESYYVELWNKDYPSNKCVNTCTLVGDEDSMPDEIVYLGNASLIDPSVFTDTGEVFCIAVSVYDIQGGNVLNNAMSLTYITLNRNSELNLGSTDFYLRIAKVVDGNIIKTIDQIYLPKATSETYGVVIVDDEVTENSNNPVSSKAVNASLNSSLFSFKQQYIVSPDWLQTNERAFDYIKNKPSIAGEDVSGKTYEINGSTVVADDGAEVFNSSANIATGNFSHAEGCDTTASGGYSHAEGYSTTASGAFSHAEGYSTTASGIRSHAEGSNTTASGAGSHAEGSNTIAYFDNQHTQGKYNIDGEYAHIVGNGSYSKRSNAHTIDWDGNAWFSGDVYVGSTSGTNMDDGSKKLATEEYVDGKISADLGNLATKDTVSKTDLASDVQTSLGKADTALQSYTETDPTVYAWAKAPTKPTYTYDEVGAAKSTIIQVSDTEPTDEETEIWVNMSENYDGTSGGFAGSIPTKTSQLENDSGFITFESSLTVTGVDTDGATHTWIMYGVKQ